MVDADDALLDAIAREVDPGPDPGHGAETPERIAEISRGLTGKPVIKVIRVEGRADMLLRPTFSRGEASSS